MLLKRFYDTKLAQASYLVGCQATGEALVIDPNRDVEQYIAAASAEGMRLAWVTETHIHADFVSGTRELSARSGARMVLSDEGGADWRYGYAAAEGAMLVKDGATFKVGNIVVQVLHTPGHTPEHLSFMITDGAATDRPMGVFTGDFIFVGDVGRPDLLEKAAGVQGTMEAGARQLFASLQRFKQYPDYLQLWPGHGAGSACGKALGAVPSSTLGYERFANWGLATEREEDFVELVLAGQPEPPTYFAKMKYMNRDGPRVLHGRVRPERLPDERLGELLAQGAVVVDTRRAADFAAGFVAGTINIPLNASFTTWAGWLLSYDQPFYLIADDSEPGRVDEACRDLAMIGLDQVAGYFGSEAIEAWRASAGALDAVPQLSARVVGPQLAAGEVYMLDVRGRSEWDAGHVPGVRNIPLGYLRAHLDELPRDVPVVMQCQTGSRSQIAASLAHAAGLRNVANLAGGIQAWGKAGLPVEREAEPATVR